jgi:hypothetical protein
VFSQIVNAADIWMGYAAGDLYFLMKTPQEGWVSSVFRRDDLDGDALTQLAIESLEYFSHAAPAKRLKDFESIRDDIARLQRGLIGMNSQTRNRTEKLRAYFGMLHQPSQLQPNCGILNLRFQPA